MHTLDGPEFLCVFTIPWTSNRTKNMDKGDVTKRVTDIFKVPTPPLSPKSLKVLVVHTEVLAHLYSKE